MPEDILKFQETVWNYYRQHGRKLPWRQPETDGSFNPYKILVSEIMLQQTQVKRVMPKYYSFLKQFPDVRSLARAPLSEVLIAWSGLGYNRRAKYLHDAAKKLVSRDNPWKVEDLIGCKGIGFNTAAAVMVYAYNQPVVFIETNIRTIYIYHFFSGRSLVSDKEILDLVTLTLISRKERPEHLGLPSPGALAKSAVQAGLRWGGATNPGGEAHYREWYWALMDYGSYIKNTAGNISRFSKHHTKQPLFEGSRRQVRGRVLQLLAKAPQTAAQLRAILADERLGDILSELEAEKLIELQNMRYILAT